MKQEELVYVHELKKLDPKSAEIESVGLIRKIKKAVQFPLTEEKLKRHISEYFISKDDMDLMSKSASKIEPALKELDPLLNLSDEIYEQINIKRTHNTLTELHKPLLNNIEYAKKILEFQEKLASEFFQIISDLPKLNNNQEKAEYNKRISKIFETILRNNDFCFEFEDIISEAQLKHIRDLGQVIPKGYLFHILLEEEINKMDFEKIKTRLPDGALARQDKIEAHVMELSKGIERAYQINMSMINLALILYSYIKLVKS